MQAFAAALNAVKEENEQSASRGDKMTKDFGISKEHSSDMEAVSKYMETNRVPELFNEILTRVLDERPQNAKEAIIEYLKAVEKTSTNDPHCQKVY